MTSKDILDALAVRHPMDGFNGMPGRWVFAREVQAATGGYGDVQRFDAVAIGLVPSVKYARVIYEVKVSRADWLKELKPIPDIRSTYGRVTARTARRVKQLMETDQQPPSWHYYSDHGFYRKFDVALEVSTEFWIATPPGIVKPGEIPPEAGHVEVRPHGDGLRCYTVIKAPIRDTPCPDQTFWASVLRKTARRVDTIPETVVL